MNALTVNMDHFLPSPSAVCKFFTTVYCELLQIILLATLALVVGNHLWHSALLAVIVIMSAIGILFTGYRKLNSNTKATGTAEENEVNKRSPWIKLTGNRLLNIALTWAFGIFKLVESLKKQTMTLTIEDFIVGTVIGSIMTLIGYFGDDHPTALDWFFHRDYNQSILIALNTLWIICAYVFAALLLLPLGIIWMPKSALEFGGFTYVYVTALAATSDSRIAIELTVVAVFVPMTSFRVMLNMYPLTLSNSALKLLRQICNIIFFWGVLWMTLLIWVRSNPEVEHHFAGIYTRWSGLVAAFAVNSLGQLLIFFFLGQLS